MEVIICGSRGWTDTDLIERVIARLPEDAVIVHGDAQGADKIAEAYALARGLTVKPFPAEWNKYGRSAGPRRNQQMLDETEPDYVIAFRKHGASPGTDDMIRRAKNAGIKTVVFKRS